MTTRDVAYDVETISNVFTAVFRTVDRETRWIFEISEWNNQATDLVAFLYAARDAGWRFVGFNNEGFDYPILHFIASMVAAQGTVTAEQIYWKSQEIIGGQSSGDRFAHIIWPRDRIVPQLDLYKIHHFDNMAKATGLKALQVAMRAHSVEDMPVFHGATLTPADVPMVLGYNCHDVDETIRFYHYSAGAIAFRDALGPEVTNYNDTKIGKDYFVKRLEAASPGITRGRTPRDEIALRDVIFPYVQFQHPEFARVLDYLRSTTIRDTKSAPELKGLSAEVGGLRFDFGTGGIHASLANRHVRSSDTHELVDVDVASYYPNLAIKNRVYPLHLGELFCDIYAELYEERKRHPKKSNESGMLKLALNGVYGESNNKYGSFLDPAYTMTITINGQLLLCMLAEWFASIPGLQLVQANTDGVTALVPREHRARFDELCRHWERFTCLELETAVYSDMWIRDVNSYVARSVDGKMKRIGAYAYETARENPATREIGWHKDHSALVVPKAAEAVFLGGNVTQFIWSHPDPWDFMLRAKAPRGSRLILDNGQELPPTVRYYVAREGHGLVKVMPELPSKPGSGERHMRINVGRKVAICNVATDFRPDNIDRDFYIAEARKLTDIIKP